jgi:hypothetical protein
MAEPDQMSREELLAARERVATQLDRLWRVTGYGFHAGVPSRAAKVQLRAELQAILDEIDTELAELGSQNA